MELVDGTYIRDRITGEVRKYAWAYGYFVGTTPLFSEAEITRGMVFGVWNENGTRYLDRVVHVNSLPEALALAEEHEQIAIWDARVGEAIYLAQGVA